MPVPFRFIFIVEKSMDSEILFWKGRTTLVLKPNFRLCFALLFLFFYQKNVYVVWAGRWEWKGEVGVSSPLFWNPLMVRGIKIKYILLTFIRGIFYFVCLFVCLVQIVLTVRYLH